MAKQLPEQEVKCCADCFHCTNSDEVGYFCNHERGILDLIDSHICSSIHPDCPLHDYSPVINKSLDNLRCEIRKINAEHGFRDDSVFNDPVLCKFATCSMLLVCEVAEMFEAFRSDPDGLSSKIPNFKAIEEEHADVLIRAIDFADQFEFPFERAINAKLNYNRGRKYKHGKRF